MTGAAAGTTVRYPFSSATSLLMPGTFIATMVNAKLTRHKRCSACVLGVHGRSDEVRRIFEKFGEVRDVYLPRKLLWEE